MDIENYIDRVVKALNGVKLKERNLYSASLEHDSGVEFSIVVEKNRNNRAVIEVFTHLLFKKVEGELIDGSMRLTVHLEFTTPFKTAKSIERRFLKYLGDWKIEAEKDLADEVKRKEGIRKVHTKIRESLGAASSRFGVSYMKESLNLGISDIEVIDPDNIMLRIDQVDTEQAIAIIKILQRK